MNTAQNILASFLAVFFAVATIAAADENRPAHSLELTASTPQVEVLPRNGARNYLRLPSLGYTFQLTAQCSGLFSPLSASVSIADSRKSLSADQLVDDGAGAEFTVTIPAKQLAPIAIENFCSQKADDINTAEFSADARLEVPAAFSVQTSLLCVYKDQQEMVYSSDPLAITLVCNSPKETE